jgi:hypothetical protein
MGLRDETIQWLLRGKTQQWIPDAASPIQATAEKYLQVYDTHTAWSDCKYMLSVDIPNEGNDIWAHAYVTSPRTTASPTIHIHATHKSNMTTLMDSAQFITGLFSFDRTLYIVSKFGTVYSLTVPQLMDSITLPRCRFIRHIKTFKQFNVPHAIKGEENRFQLRDGATKDGDVFIFLTIHNYLLSASLSSPSKRMTILSSEVQAFTLIDDAILFQTTYGTVNVLSLKQRHMTLNVDVCAIATKQILPVPALQAMWFTDKDGKVYYKCEDFTDYQKFHRAFK